MNKNHIKCSVCGKFIKYDDIGTDKIKVKYIPDTEYTVESTEFCHLGCIENKVLTK